ncbi:MAG: flavin reductase protein [Ramlibacter sp.]|nr:flavin reductase protein [Ramlibacter sp.]
MELGRFPRKNQARVSDLLARTEGNGETTVPPATPSLPFREGDPTQDARAFRHCLGQYATGVTVITAQVDNDKAGVTANSFSSLSLDPPLILWSISRKSRSFALFERASHFAVNILAADQIELSQGFSGAETDKFAGVAWQPGLGGAPLLDDVVASFECSTEALHDGGDHLIMIGRVRRFAQHERAALLFAQGRYAVAEDHPDLKRDRVAPALDDPAGAQEIPLMNLLFRAHNLTSGHFQQHREAQGLTRAQVRVLIGLYEVPGLDQEQLAARMYLGRRDAEDAVEELFELGCLLRTSDGSLRLSPAGAARREALIARAAQFEADFLSGIPKEQIECGRSFLKQLIQNRQ